MATTRSGKPPARRFAQAGLIGKAGAGNKPGSVEGNHSSGAAVTGRLEQPTRESARDRRIYSPIWSCSGRGLPCRGLLPAARCALTAPFHPYRAVARRSVFCGTFHGLAPSRRYLAPCPKEPGLSSMPIWHSDCLADSGVSGARILLHLRSGRLHCELKLTILLSIL